MFFYVYVHILCVRNTHATPLVDASLLLLLAFGLDDLSRLVLDAGVRVETHHDTEVLQRVSLQHVPVFRLPVATTDMREGKYNTHIIIMFFIRTLVREKKPCSRVFTNYKVQ